jgi:hypothetical protein
MEYVFWFLLFCAVPILGVLQSTSPVIVGMLVAGGCFGFATTQAAKIAQGFLNVQKEQLATQKEQLLLERQKVDAILKLDSVDQEKVWSLLEGKDS